MITNKNFSRNPAPDVGGETHFVSCNFSQLEPVLDGTEYKGVPILVGSGPCIFENCNLVNCEVPAGSTMTRCNTTIRRSKVEVSSESLIIDGQDFGSIPSYSDFIYGRQTAPGVYVYESTPIEIEIKVLEPEDEGAPI